MMVPASAVILMVVVLMTGLDPAGLSSWTAIPATLIALWSWLRWPVFLVALALVFGWLYRTVPCAGQRRQWITVGGLLAALVWLVASAAMAEYLDRSDSYARVYGAVGDVIVLMLWIYLAAFVLLLGAEINMAILRAMRHVSDRRLVRVPERGPHRREVGDGMSDPSSPAS